MILELTDEETAAVDAALVMAHSAYERMAGAFRTRAPQVGEKCGGKIALADGVRYKILVAKYGAERAAEIAAEREAVPTLEELYNGEPVRDAAADRKPDAGAADRDGGEPANGDTRPPCYADNGNAPYCAGVDCAAWGDCHGDRLRGVADCTGARR